MMRGFSIAAFGARGDSRAVLGSLGRSARDRAFALKGDVRGTTTLRLGAGAAPVTGLGSRRDDGWLPGRSLTHLILRMRQLYCVPVPCRCGRHGRYRSEPGIIHLSSEACPFAALSQNPAFLGSCCTLFADSARKNLIAAYEFGLANDMEDDLSSEHAFMLGLRILAWAEEAEGRLSDLGAGERPRGRVTAVTSDEEGLRAVAHAKFEEAIASVRVAARWYEHVARRGYGVKTQWR